MSAKYTPGPWYIKPGNAWTSASGTFAQWGRFEISAGGDDASQETYYRVADVSNVNNSVQNEANARLIAAAPDLLEALQRALNVLDATGATDEANAARAAIEKATEGGNV